MTHYRLTLTAGKAPNSIVLAEIHKDVPRLEQGWGRKMRASKAVSAHLRQCYVPDDECNSFQAWMDSKDAHQDDVEAERLRSADVRPADDDVRRRGTSEADVTEEASRGEDV